MKRWVLSIAMLFGITSNAWSGLATELVAGGLERPVWIGAPASEKGRLWIAEQGGKVWVVELDQTEEKGRRLFMDFSGVVARENNEQGLLGIAFAPDYEDTGRFYVNYTDQKGDTRIVRFTYEEGKELQARAGELLLKIEQPYGNHNGGWLGFGNDGFLYVATGDGGAANDPKNLAQDLKSHLGKILRLDVSGDKGYQVPVTNFFAKQKGALPEIHALGLRNPWRCSFDQDTGNLWIADVGQNHWEEINAVAIDKLGGKNFGWRLREGQNETPKKEVGGDLPLNHVSPIYTYAHGGGEKEGRSITGGYFYRGKKVPELLGRYIFADFQNPRVWSLEANDSKGSRIKDHTKELQPAKGGLQLISTFGEDSEGELYLADLRGSVYRIVSK